MTSRIEHGIFESSNRTPEYRVPKIACCSDFVVTSSVRELRPDDYSVDHENGVVTVSPETTGPAFPASAGWSQQRGKKRKMAQWKRELRGRI